MAKNTRYIPKRAKNISSLTVNSNSIVYPFVCGTKPTICYDLFPSAITFLTAQILPIAVIITPATVSTGAVSTVKPSPRAAFAFVATATAPRATAPNLVLADCKKVPFFIETPNFEFLGINPSKRPKRR
jgi:hypothetical protein